MCWKFEIEPCLGNRIRATEKPRWHKMGHIAAKTQRFKSDDRQNKERTVYWSAERCIWVGNA